MDENLFSEWVKEIDRKFAAQDRNIALIIEECPIYPIVEGLEAIELIFLPPNTILKRNPIKVLLVV